jgi:hypothetical protein
MTYTPDDKKRIQIYYFMSECLIGYSRRIKSPTSECAKSFNRCNIWSYIFECYDSLHLGNANDVITDIASRIRKGTVYSPHEVSPK